MKNLGTVIEENATPQAELEVIKPDTQLSVFDRVKLGAMDFLKHARELAAAITNDVTYKEAAQYRQMLDNMEKEAIAQVEPLRVKAYATYQEVLRQRDEAVKPFRDARQALDAPLAAYYMEQKRKADAERERQAAEARRQAEEAQIKAAEAAQKAGNASKAEAILNKPVVVPVQKKIEPPKVEGMTFAEYWSADEIVNMKLLVEAVAAGKVPIQALLPNMAFLNGQARLLKDKLEYPGVTVKMEKRPRGTGKR